MDIQNRRDSGNFKGCSPLLNCHGLISFRSAIAYFAYTWPLDLSIILLTKDKVLQITS